MLAAAPLAAIASFKALMEPEQLTFIPVKLPGHQMDFDKVYREHVMMIARKMMEANKEFMKPHTVKLWP